MGKVLQGGAATGVLRLLNVECVVSDEIKLRCWMEEAIIGLNLCPFARAPWQQGRVDVVWATQRDVDALYLEVMDAIEALLNVSADETQTTLVVCRHGVDDFEHFLDLVDGVQYALEQTQLDDVLQLATFHPNYLFDGEPVEDVSHYTNRAPWPIIHLLRQADVTWATTQHPDTYEIPARNVARLESMGKTAVVELWSRWMD